MADRIAEKIRFSPTEVPAERGTERFWKKALKTIAAGAVGYMAGMALVLTALPPDANSFSVLFVPLATAAVFLAGYHHFSRRRN